jgi:hypothetical protein
MANLYSTYGNDWCKNANITRVPQFYMSVPEGFVYDCAQEQHTLKYTIPINDV